VVLEEYLKKRKFNKTPEPVGAFSQKGEFKFVIQKHQASHLHYDFRLELPESSAQKDSDPKESVGIWVLKSWAVPKEFPQNKGIKRLAVEVEDHPVDYINFEGEIPAGEYGAGTVEIWDKGNFDLIERNKNLIEVYLYGQKIKGHYVLVRTKMGGKDKNWLLFKKGE